MITLKNLVDETSIHLEKVPPMLVLLSSSNYSFKLVTKNPPVTTVLLNATCLLTLKILISDQQNAGFNS